ncbi:beta-galactosidase/beta-glucuronidase [Microbacterium keratanolyticum]|uniref:Glycosyl hydrolase n=1 Tax=Microbacterium keratanolyticum TaxID=67574 RepID=A0A9W6M964_9MICO|nr:sugar-binding domain-containing protein [Microbacterium keratanolyticum]MBM7470179.1 beta-galactosidase/beta-glucuronidase [Microbacterium keratanolyticum]GLK02258.1 glycosyl hydrolase [Microbacterium keratanolyticum]
MSTEIPLAEYPRPQLRRDEFEILNGTWECAFTEAGVRPASWDQKILVPFSPETTLSGVERQLLPHETLWYRRSLAHRNRPGERTILHFGAVDQSCSVYVNGIRVGSHTGGYLPFAIDVSEALGDGSEHELIVEVRDVSDTSHHSVGKQRLKNGGIWYRAQSGIWQTVWLERVPEQHITALRMRTPETRVGMQRAEVELTVECSADDAVPVAVIVTDDGHQIAAASGMTGTALHIPIADPRLWSPDDPHLYDLEITVGADEVRSYVGIRSVDVAPDALGVPRLRLNGVPYPHIGVLDQGYWEDGLYTARDDEALVRDIREMKDLGFTMLRKHIKIEPLRWYHHCDRVGMLVWQDAVNGGTTYKPWVISTPVISPRIGWSDRHHRIFGRSHAEGREQLLRELDEMIRHLSNAPSIVTWVPFNEGWGQFDAAQAAERVRRLDPDRIIDHASGWHDQRAGDLRSLHVYFQPIRPARWWGRDGRALVISEYGGYSLRLPGHRYPPRHFGYRRMKTRDEFTEAYARLHEREVIPAIRHGLSATVYTQLADVEDESNGLLTANREELKADAATVRRLNAQFRAEFDAAVIALP